MIFGLNPAWLPSKGHAYRVAHSPVSVAAFRPDTHDGVVACVDGTRFDSLPAGTMNSMDFTDHIQQTEVSENGLVDPPPAIRPDLLIEKPV